MSWSAKLHERIVIRNDRAGAPAMIEALRGYVSQLDRMGDISELVDFRMVLSLDGAETVVELKEEEEANNTWMVSPRGMYVRNVPHTIWPEDHPLKRALAALDTAREIRLEWTGVMMYMVGVYYGDNYWRSAIRPIAPTDCIEYWVCGTDDSSDMAGALRDHGLGLDKEVPRVAGIDAVSHISEWFGSITLYINYTKAPDLKAFEEELKRIVDDFAQRIDGRDIDAYIGGTSEMATAEIFINFTVSRERIDELAKILQRVADLVAGTPGVFYDHGGYSGPFEFDLMPLENGANGFKPFALVGFDFVDGRIQVSSCCYEE